MAQAIHADAKADGETDRYVCEEIGEDLLLKNRGAEAAPFFKLAFEGLSKDRWLQQHEPDRLKRLEELSRAK
jgi:hypothetical protein